MTTIKRFTPDYAMHAARFEPFAREAEHGEYVRFDAHQQKVSALEAERDALAQRVEMLAQNLGNAIWGEQEALQRVNALAVENQSLKDSNRKLINEQQASWPIGLLDSFIAEHDPQTPATSAALAAIRNEATARALKHLCDCQLISATVAELKATELREGK
ncbi:hypothetical protein [Serratia marcescens]|uniref:hypothetical protein n=1 Tax=Serratia marcescens TaxID=615 RepID=UPI0015731D2B|nr:hypothetical protein [Serratia marcescens]NSM15206.1 hypothetical protein [Serratia marcescens]NSM95622.1 hypothetical protein [Serratia marcescens]CAF2553494.1 hypothetical protein AI2872V1_0866 [Serratia marcescens]CAF2645808.1 hypothetical protein AI2884V1_0866 [Serratia marcescens]CAH5087334.1 hypothetical protein AI2872V1_0866 [Serratia marcescens]